MKIKDQVSSVRNQEAVLDVLETFVLILLYLLKHLAQVNNHTIS